MTRRSLLILAWVLPEAWRVFAHADLDRLRACAQWVNSRHYAYPVDMRGGVWTFRAI